MSLEIKYIPLSFMNSNKEILKQIKNSVLFSFLLSNFEETTLEYYLDSTQYGYTASALENGKHKFVRITDIKNGDVDWNHVPFCNCNAVNKYILKKNDILIARTGGTTGKSFLVSNTPKNSVFASYLIRLRTNEKTEIEFINYFLNSYLFWAQIVEMKSGSAMPNVNAEKLKTLRLPKCDKEVQKKIISAYKSNDKTNFHDLFQKINYVDSIFNNNNLLSTQLTHQLDLVKQLRQAFLREAMQGRFDFTQQPNANEETGAELLAKIKAKKEELIKTKKIKKQKPMPPIKQEEIPFDIPKNWVWCRLGEIANNIHYGFNASAKPNKDDVRLLRITDIQDNKVEWKTVPGCDFSEKDIKSYLLKENDIVIARTGGTIGKSYIVKGITVKSLFASYLIRVIPNSSINADFLKLFLESPYYWKQLYEAAWGAGQPNVNATKLNSLILSLPSLSEQKAIVAKLDKLMAYCDSLEESIKKSQAQNEMLLQQVLKEALEPKGKDVIV